MLKEWLINCILILSIAILLVFTGAALAGDILLFSSDMHSLLTVMTLTSVVVGTAILIVVALLRLTIYSTTECSQALRSLMAVLLGSNAIFFAINYADSTFMLTVRTKFLIAKHSPGIHPEFLWIPFWLLLTYLVWWAIKRSNQQQEYKSRAQTAGLLLFPTCLVMLCLGYLLPPQAHKEKSKHLVYIILDGWPSSLSSTFSPQHPTAGTLLENAKYFPNVHSSAVWTNGYFGILYRGKENKTFTYLNPLNMVFDEVTDDNTNLIKKLQNNEIEVRGIYYHRNGMPESSSGRVTEYNGFRSLFALPRHTGILDALGLDYFVVTRGPSSKANLWNDSRPWFFSRMIPPLKPRKFTGNVLNSLLLPEMERMQTKPRDTALFFHYTWTFGNEEIPSAWHEDDADSNAKLLKQARKHGYQYPLEAEATIAGLRENSRRQVVHLEDELKNFLSQAAAGGLLDDTVVIVTADHGTSFSKGRLWYGYHPNENVTKTPVLMFGDVTPGKDERLASTPDLTQTILSFFAPKANINPEAKSLLSPDHRDHITVFTQPSNYAKEWFVIIYKDALKYRFNIHPRGNAECLKIDTTHGGEDVIESGDDVLNEVAKELHQAFVDYHITGQGAAAVHNRFKSFLWTASK